jgi:nucleoid-associated protein YgaU
MTKAAQPSASGKQASAQGKPGIASQPSPRPNTTKDSSRRHASKADSVVKGKVAVDLHRVQAGDTFSSLALRYYGSVRHAELLIDSNPHVRDPGRMAIGTVIKIPPLSPQEKVSTGTGATPATTGTGGKAATGGTGGTAGARTYRVKPGDTFYAIARDVLGDASRWKSLFELNKELVHGDPKRLQIGQVIRLPKS